MKKAQSRLRRIRRRELRRKIVFITFLLLLTLYIISKIETLNPVRALAPSQFDVVYVEKQVEVIKEVEVDRTFNSEKQQILAYIVEVFGDDAPDAIVVIRKCENGNFDPKATNYNRNGSVDRGIFQLNSQYWGGEELYDWKLNVDKAYEVFNRAGKKWTPWTCAWTVDQKNYLGQ